MSGLGIITRRRAIQASPVQGNYIRFADPVAKKLCIDNFSSDGIGLTLEDAAAVTSIGLVFAGNKELVSFDEFKYFTSVTSISNGADAVTGGAFANCTALKSISLPNSLREIRPFSFYACEALESINLNNEYITLIGNEAFKSCKKMQVDINLPNLQVLGSRVNADVFMYSGITTITSLGIISKIWGYALSDHGTFLGCTNLTSAILPETLTTIGGCAFRGCTQLAELNIPSSVTTIEGQALYNCTSLTYDTLVLNVTTLGQNALYGVSITKLDLSYILVLPDANINTQNYGAKSKLREIVLSNDLTTIKAYSFYGYSELIKINFPTSLTSILAVAFASLSLSVDVSELPKSITTLGDTPFNGAITTGILNLPNLEGTIRWSNYNYFDTKLLDGIESLGNASIIGGFMRQEKMKYAKIPATCTKIEDNAFAGCYTMEYLICYADIPPTLTNNAFGTSENYPIYVPDASVEDYKAASYWSNYADRIYPMSMYELFVEEAAILNNMSSLVCAYTFEGKSNHDPDATTVADKSMYGNDMIISMTFGSVDSATGLTSGYQDDGGLFLLKGAGKANIPQIIDSDYITAIVKRKGYSSAGAGQNSAVVGFEQTTSSNAAWIDYTDSTNFSSMNNNRRFAGKTDGEITWINANYKDMVPFSSERETQAFNGTIYVGRLRSNIAVSQRTYLYNLYIFNKSLHPLTIEAFIKKYIDETYVLPEIEATSEE